MASNDKYSQLHTNESKVASQGVFRHVRINPVTGQIEYYYPMEITDPSIRAHAKDLGLEIGRTRLGNRVIDAVMVPCKNTALDEHGREIFVDTPTETQYYRYCEYRRGVLNDQDAAKQDGRCPIPDNHGGMKRCPTRMPNPKYTPTNGELKTIPVRCEGCIYEPFRQAHTVTDFTSLSRENERGEMESFDPAAPASSYEGDRYMRMRGEYTEFVQRLAPKLADLAAMLTLEYTKSEVARMTSVPDSTVGSRAEKLKQLVKEFLDSTIIF